MSGDKATTLIRELAQETTVEKKTVINYVGMYEFMEG